VKRFGWIALAAVLGVLAGAAGMAALEDSPEVEPLARTEAPVKTAPVPEPEEHVLLVWTSGGLPPDLAGRVDALPDVRRSTVVDGASVNLVASFGADGQIIDAPAAGLSIPIDALAIDPSTYSPFFDKAAQARLQALQPGAALLGATSAALRKAGPGAVMQLDNGARVTVTDVVDDEVVGAAEVVVDKATGPTVGIDRPRFLLVSYRGDRSALEQAIGALLPDGVRARFRGRGETPYLRHADAVLPQALIKARFGEFAYRKPATDRFFDEDPGWSNENMVTAKVPILGTIRCHRAVIPALEGALHELEQRNLSFLVDKSGYQGCWVPSVIPGDGGMSRHSWGVAIDLNFTKNPTGVASAVDPRLVEVMDRWGFISGADWLVPDPGHFEYLRPPRN
jgi:D-alanyl-D-alanine carboxypeptidase